MCSHSGRCSPLLFSFSHFIFLSLLLRLFSLEEMKLGHIFLPSSSFLLLLSGLNVMHRGKKGEIMQCCSLMYGEMKTYGRQYRHGHPHTHIHKHTYCTHIDSHIATLATKALETYLSCLSATYPPVCALLSFSYKVHLTAAFSSRYVFI